MSILLFSILLLSFKLTPFHLVGFLTLWPLNFHLTFTLYFLMLNPRDWHKTRGVLSLGVLRTHSQGFSSIPCGNPDILASYYRPWNGSLTGDRVIAIKSISNVLIQHLSDLWDTIGLHAPILPLIFSLETHLFHFHLESERGASVWEHKHMIFNQNGSNNHFKEKKFTSNQIFE